MSMSALDSTKHFHYERKWQLCSDSRINSTKWSRGHDILSCSHELIYRGHDKTHLSEPNMSPPGCSKCFVWLFRDHLLFPVDDLWPTFCTTWMSAFWILNTEFDVPNFFFILKTWSCIFKNVSGYVCNHGSLNGERDTGSPRGRYGGTPSAWLVSEDTNVKTPPVGRRQPMMSLLAWPQYKGRRENTSSASSSEACIRSMAQSLWDTVSRSPFGEPWLHT